MKAPHEIYLQCEELDPSLRVYEYNMSRSSEYDIPYRLDNQECVWKTTSYTVESFSAGTFSVDAYIPQCYEFTIADVPYSDEPEGGYCPFCGNRIRVE